MEVFSGQLSAKTEVSYFQHTDASKSGKENMFAKVTPYHSWTNCFGSRKASGIEAIGDEGKSCSSEWHRTSKQAARGHHQNLLLRDLGPHHGELFSDELSTKIARYLLIFNIRMQ
ncbi:hypothetical protein AVEN_100016-1 [Araneus ventricosus]|uniref:Uncharacterized protein n=1 Tax=Araneus ventricosus TaxID=182803 RepID=A0A4Y2BJY5_ARAVE|nr:hypothetical protein AVEN_100016-1 [Araneus ventricosus]